MNRRLATCLAAGAAATARAPGVRRFGLVGLATVACGLLAGPALAQSAPALSLFAGNGAWGPSVPGPALNSPMGTSNAVAADANGNVYLSDNINAQIDKITPDGTLSVIAGDGSSGMAVPGPALSSPLDYMYALTADGAGEVFVADYFYNRILEVDAAGVLSVVVGSGAYGSPVAGPAASSPFTFTETLGSDAAGNLYYQDQNDGELWKVTPGGLQTHIAGNGTGAPAVAGDALQSPLDNSYGGFAADSAGNVYISDPSRPGAVKITPSGTLSIIAGNGSTGTPTPGPALASALGWITGVGVDSAGDVYLADDSYNLVEKVTPDGTLSIAVGDGTAANAVAGPPTASPLPGPFSLAIDGGDVLSVLAGTQIVRIGASEPSAPRNVAVTPATADGAATVSFIPPGNPGTSPISGYEVSTDGGATWHAVTTTPGAGQTLLAGLSGLAAGSSYEVLVRAVNGSGASDPSTVVALAVPAVAKPAAVTPLAASPAAASPFMVKVQFRIPATCQQPCTLRARLFLADGTTLLGARNGLTISATGRVRFFVSIDKAALLHGDGTVDAKGYRTTKTRFVVTLKNAAGRWVTVVKQGRISVAVGRIASGKAPETKGGRVF